jgi:hypothetical protein
MLVVVSDETRTGDDCLHRQIDMHRTLPASVIADISVYLGRSQTPASKAHAMKHDKAGLPFASDYSARVVISPTHDALSSRLGKMDTWIIVSGRLGISSKLR